MPDEIDATDDPLSAAVARRRGEAVTDRALAWLAANDGPYFAWVHYYDVHEPRHAPPPFDAIEDRYAGGPVDREAVVQGAIRGMIDSLEDPYSAYLTSDQYQSSLQGISGEFEGVGAEIAAQASDGTQDCSTLGPTCRLVIIAPIGGSPAEKAGLSRGDIITRIKGEAVESLEQLKAIYAAFEQAPESILVEATRNRSVSFYVLKP